MSRFITLAAAGLIAGGAAALPASASPLAPLGTVEAAGLVTQAQTAERADRTMRQGLKTLQRNSDQRRPSGDGTVRHPRAAAENARSNHETGGPSQPRRR